MKFKIISGSLLLIITIVLFFFLPWSNARGQELLLTAYGSGKIEVRLYTDYFCPPCRRMEPAVEPILRDLIRRQVIRLTLVDTPFSRHSPLYARYFLYALKEKNDLGHALKVRHILFEAAGSRNVTTKEQLEKILKRKGIPYQPYEVKPAFGHFNALIKEDRIDETPTCVIVKGGKKEAFTGQTGIVNALKLLK
ncbi:MAG TPA: thioredoxin domain-containing protein [Chitinispirillaceae bacterium]|nr:thioredoxin domain-containing protein [Chitinispirillaceae bacterium]